MTEIRMGSSAFTAAGWEGTFYPEGSYFYAATSMRNAIWGVIEPWHNVRAGPLAFFSPY